MQDDKALMTPGPVRDKLLSQLQHMGAKWVRANVLYGKTQGGTDLTELNSLVDAARAHGLHVQATLMSDPRYVNPTSGLTYQNNDPKLMAQFAKNVASREKGRVERYSVGNEPNYGAFTAGADTNAKQAGRTYRNLYRAGQQALKSADPKAQVLFGEITNQKNAPEFLKYALAGKPIKTDGFAYHPYQGDTGAWDINSLPALQKTLAHYKRTGKLQTAKGRAAPLYLTEMGYQRGQGTTAQRAAKVAKDYQLAKRAGARELIQYQLTDKTGLTSGTDGYGQPAGRSSASDGGGWDTSLGTADGDLSVLIKALRKKKR